MAFADAQASGRVTEAWGRVEITLAGTVEIGDHLGYSSGWKRGLGTVGGVIQSSLVALQRGVSGDVITAARGAVVDGRFSGGTPGATLYMAEGTDAGKFTETIPSTTNDATTPMGVVISTTAAIISPRQSAVTLSS